ncbi:hypothetical protein WG66_007329 [Moniliophthora roreri]|nr:hypothetical protein WG66_007329 [Moniliophthora roreri]
MKHMASWVACLFDYHLESRLLHLSLLHLDSPGWYFITMSLKREEQYTAVQVKNFPSITGRLSSS